MLTRNINVKLPFRDRGEAGRLLATQLRSYADRPDAVVLALPHGGVPVAAEVASALNLPLFVFAVRKLGVPGQEEVTMGAITDDGRTLINPAIVKSLHISAREIELSMEQQLRDLARRERLYCRGHRTPEMKGKCVILVGDGVATGSTLLLAAQTLRAEGATHIVMALPVVPLEIARRLQHVANQLVCLATPERFVTAERCYQDFHEVTNQEMCQILDHLFERAPELKSA